MHASILRTFVKRRYQWLIPKAAPQTGKYERKALPMAPVQQPKTSAVEAEKPGKSRTGLILGGAAGAFALVGIGAMVLTSGPEAPSAQIASTGDRTIAQTVNPLPTNAPVQPLGAAAPEGSWMRGIQTSFSLSDPQEFPRLRIEAADLETGRYAYPGDLVIAGDIKTSGVDITAGSITVNGAIAANHVTLTTNEAAPVQQNHQAMIISGLNHREFLVAFEQFYRPGNISVTGGVAGNTISLAGGDVAIGGDVSGQVAVTGSTGSVARAVIDSDYYTTYTFPNTWRDGIPAEAFTERERVRLPAGDTPTVSIAGAIGAGVTVDQGAAPVVTQEATATPATPVRRP
jgi:hypothetical protein